MIYTKYKNFYIEDVPEFEDDLIRLETYYGKTKKIIEEKNKTHWIMENAVMDIVKFGKDAIVFIKENK